MQNQSKLMIFFRRLGFESIAWSIRRLYCPVKATDLVLEVGSGGSPYSRSNVLCDPYEETAERHYEPLIKDRPIIQAFAEELPFKDNAFDFVIASHVLEHSSNPIKFLSELQRVATAGYIEVPDAFMERLTAYPFHKLEITEKNETLIISYKKNTIHDEEVVSMFSNKASNIFPKWAKSFPFNFHVRYYWSKDKGGIKYKILNPEVNLNWNWNSDIKASNSIKIKKSIIEVLKKRILKIHRYIFSQNKINKNLNIIPLLKCPKCNKNNFRIEKKQVCCNKCNNKYFYNN